MYKEEYVYYIGRQVGLNDKHFGIGAENFVPLELSVKAEIDPTVAIIGSKLYIGEDVREVVKSIIGRADHEEIKKLDQKGILEIIEKIVLEQEQRFVDFLNSAGPYSVKRHTLSLIPGIGKKVLAFMLTEREANKIRNFKDLERRCENKKVPFVPLNAFSKRIYNEIIGNTKENLFVQ